MSDTKILKFKSIDEIPDDLMTSLNSFMASLTEDDIQRGIDEGFAQFYYKHPELVKDDEKRKLIMYLISETKNKMKINRDGSYDFNTTYWKKICSIMIGITGHI